LRDGSWLPRFGKVQVVASPILRPEGHGWSDMVRLRDSVRAEILKHCGEGAFDSLLAGAPRPETGV
jgi:hypothetical protein